MTLGLVLIAAGVMGASGLLCVLAPSALGRDRAFAGMMVLGALAGCVGAIAALAGSTGEIASVWPLPWGRFWVRLDALSAVFLLPVFVVPALGAVYSSGGRRAYWAEGHGASAASLRGFYGLLAGAMALVLVARDGVLFLIAWEAMALAAFFAVATEDEKPEVRRAAWVYLVATHMGTLALIAMFAMLNAETGRLDLAPVAIGVLAPEGATAIFLLGMVGFGVKAGIVPLHVWLPGAHANAPSHVSAVLSGVMLNMGVYGLCRLASVLPDPPAWWGWTLAGLGAGSAVVGITFASTQHDFKRLLAYSSIENMGVVVLGLGTALVGRASGNAALTGLGLAGALVHMWNHAAFKPLLFMVAGGVLHATGTRNMNLLGGLARAMPRTAAAACLACIAIGALPPLNGFIGEWLLYRGLLDGVALRAPGFSAGFAAGAAALALTGGLVVLTFVRFYATIFLGAGRSEAAARAHEADLTMLGPMGVLCVLCAGLGVLAFATVPVLTAAVGVAGTEEAARALGSGVLGPLRWVGAVFAGVLVASAAGILLVRRAAAPDRAPRALTWDCGYARPTARMQYGESSLAQMIAGLFAWVLWPTRATPGALTARDLFPAPQGFRTEVPDVVLDRAVRPGLLTLTRWTLRLRLLQRGKVQVYMVYILLVVIVLLVLEVPASRRADAVDRPTPAPSSETGPP